MTRDTDCFQTARELLRGGLSPEDAADIAGLQTTAFVNALNGEPEDIRGADTRTDDVLGDMASGNRARYALANELTEGDHVTAHVEFTRVPGDTETELELKVTGVETASDENPPALDVRFTQLTDESGYGAYERGQKWRGRFGKPRTRGDNDHGQSSIYHGDEWAQNSGIFHRMERFHGGDGDD